MPPKKVLRTSKSDICDKNPRVILGPLNADAAASHSYRFSTLPATSGLYNKPEFSDITLKVADDSYYGHKLVLCSASDVFARMLGSNWKESKCKELILKEDTECVKVFDRFLYYLYTGTIVISENYVIHLYLLADKYNVKPLYDECVKVIENGLKVFVVQVRPDSPQSASRSAAHMDKFRRFLAATDSSSMDTDSSDSDSSDSNDHDISLGSGRTPSKSHVSGSGNNNHHNSGSSSSNSGGEKRLVASEAFPLSLVMKLLLFCNNECITNAAMYNLEARLGTQLKNGSFNVWNDLPVTLLVQLLSDDHFFCSEYILFKAVKSWLKAKQERRTEEVLNQVLECIRYPVLTTEELYLVEKDELVRQSPAAVSMVQEAIRYRLFSNCTKTADCENWSGSQYQARTIKTDKGC